MSEESPSIDSPSPGAPSPQEAQNVEMKDLTAVEAEGSTKEISTECQSDLNEKPANASGEKAPIAAKNEQEVLDTESSDSSGKIKELVDIDEKNKVKSDTLIKTDMEEKMDTEKPEDSLQAMEVDLHNEVAAPQQEDVVTKINDSELLVDTKQDVSSKSSVKIAEVAEIPVEDEPHVGAPEDQLKLYEQETANDLEGVLEPSTSSVGAAKVVEEVGTAPDVKESMKSVKSNEEDVSVAASNEQISTAADTMEPMESSIISKQSDQELCIAVEPKETQEPEVKSPDATKTAKNSANEQDKDDSLPSFQDPNMEKEKKDLNTDEVPSTSQNINKEKEEEKSNTSDNVVCLDSSIENDLGDATKNDKQPEGHPKKSDDDTAIAADSSEEQKNDAEQPTKQKDDTKESEMSQISTPLHDISQMPEPVPPRQLDPGNGHRDDSYETMDTGDSQESTNLIIDEASESLSRDAIEKIDEPNKANIEGTIDDKRPSDDDDVIPIEQLPLPVIEIDDDEDEMVAEKSNDKETKQQHENNVMEVDSEAMTCSNDIDNSEQLDSLLQVAKQATVNMRDENENKDANEANEEISSGEIFYNKECINYECQRKHKQFLKVPHFAFSYFKVNKKMFKIQYICADCYDKALEMYEEYCGLISAKRPLLLEDIPSGRQEFVEIIDSSDEEDSSEAGKNTTPEVVEFSSNDLCLIDSQLNDTIKTIMERVDIQSQLTWSKTILSERIKRVEMENEQVNSHLRSLQHKADKIHETLYSCPKIKIRQLQPLDLNSGKSMCLENLHPDLQAIPTVGEIVRPPIQINGIYYAVKNNTIASWVPCKVVETVDNLVPTLKNIKCFRIKFLKSPHQLLKTVPAKHLAYYDPPSVRLPIGTRVIAYFDATSLARGREKMSVQSAFYPGIIAEPLKPNNKFRYLIFYDDGYTQYVYHKDVRLVCHVSENVWEDVHFSSREFIQKYLTQYSINRPMVQTQKGQSMNTESNGNWLHARVVDIDCSLVLMQFEGSKSHTEWIYRGSLRLGPVFKEYQKSLQKNTTVPISRLPRRTEPFIRYTQDEETSSQQQQQQKEKANESNRAVARKTFGRPESMMNNNTASVLHKQLTSTPTVKHLNNSTIYLEDENKPKGKVVYYTAKRNLPPRKYVPHECSPNCLFEITHNLSAYSPLSKPLLSGWERFIQKQKIKKIVAYRAPCGKVFRNMKELHRYLRVTENVLNVDNFDFSHETSCLAEYVIESAIVQKRDISCGQEKMAIPLVNSYDNTLPPECKYSAKVIPTEGVHINKDPEFFVGCECEDDCSDKTKCSCWQLTIAGAKYGNPHTPIEEFGYQYKRLLEHVPTGIYECNPRCKCRSNCLNRVVQHSLQLKLQVFKTSNRGWGLRCINDIPRGTFVCVYAGHLLTEAKANEGGQDAGDEYFAELDYIEVVEQLKEGYESTAEALESDDEDSYQPEQDDDDFTPSKPVIVSTKRQSAMKSTRSSNQENDSQERQVINFNPNADMNEDSVRENSVRKLYGKDEACYVMDAKISGNLGRYFNHSCAPNMFVQNVFVDTHDLRFPWVAFFASCNIRAGTELTWNYNYEVGVVPGKVLYCQCGAPNCRLRLL